ncbi:hypothetical protein RKE29_10070 [Streptomyces sp. B1866]|uniref:SCO2583 family membrane protein n=1 Tax=Streptomyces sp. B1866 TaxID=3075431 RepID=UPI0028925935|nr:hypothetical protein [Streptomyces sp. B1866]MDT3396989.1 hypothetical protein [Streptomyces sp. B1866]
MTGRGNPPEGTPEGVPGGGEDEYRSVVFDESFVRAARLQEFSARERLGGHGGRAVRSRHLWARAGASRQAAVLVLLIAVAFATAIYMGVRHPYQDTGRPGAGPMHGSVVPLSPRGQVPGGRAAELIDKSPARAFGGGAEGITLPPARRTGPFSESQVMTALTTAKQYVVESAVDPVVLTGGMARPVRMLLDPDQFNQFDRSLAQPADDGQHAATAWLARFDPDEVALADEPVRVQGTLSVAEMDAAALEVTADHTFVYALRPAGEHRADRDSLFTVRRTTRFRFDRADLRERHLEVVQSIVQAGPQSCAVDAAGYLHPLLAGQTAKNDAKTGINPYATGRPTVSLCGVLSPDALPGGPQKAG